MIDRLAPARPSNGYLRIAVAQLHYTPSAVISESSLLDQPFGLEDSEPWCKVPAGLKFRDLLLRRKVLGAQMRELYCEQIAAKLAGIIEHCAKWHCNLLVLPEYSVPPECIARLLETCGSMAVVLGTHYVEPTRTRTTFYQSLGITNPKAGHAIALVASGGAIVGSQLKMQQSKWEPDIRLSQEWAPIPLEALGNRPLGILICIDFLNDKADSFARFVQPHLAGDMLLAVPSHTPSGSREEFEQSLRKEAKRYGRPVAYANTASGGGSTVYVEDANTDKAFPLGIAVLEPGQEGVAIVDIDAERNRPRDSRATRLDHRPVARPVAASQILYLADQSGKDHELCIEDVVADSDLDRLVEAVKTHQVRLEASAIGVGRHTADRVLDLIEKIDNIDDSERVLCRLRDVFLAASILSPLSLRKLMLDIADDETGRWNANGDPELTGFIAKCRSQLQAAKNGAL